MVVHDASSWMKRSCTSVVLSALLSCSGVASVSGAAIGEPERGTAFSATFFGAIALSSGLEAPQLVTYNPSASNLNFGNTLVGSTSVEILLTVIETSSVAATVTGVNETCADFSHSMDLVYLTDGFEVSRVSSTTLPVSLFTISDADAGTTERQLLEIFFSFTPVARGPAPSCEVTVVTTGVDTTKFLNGIGVAPVLDVTPVSLVFPDRPLNTNSSAQNFTVSNNGDAGQNLSVSSLALNTNPEDWVINFDNSTPIAPSGSRIGTVVFSPGEAGTQNATLTITGNDPVDPDEPISLIGNGLGGASAFGSVADTGDGDLAEGEQTIGGISQLLVSFHGAMSNPAGNSAPGDVTNPANYRLSTAGPNAVLETEACGPAGGDDVAVAVSSVEYFSGPFLAALSFTGALGLGKESYRLHVCPNIEDTLGAATAPNFRSFVVMTAPRLANPNLDDSLAGWAITEPSPGSLVWQSIDAGNAPSSGSAGVSTTDGAGQFWGLSQCVEFDGDRNFVRLRARIASPVADDPAVAMAVEHFVAAGCSGASLGVESSPAIIGDSEGLWVTSAREGTLPIGARSALVTASVLGGSAAEFAVAIDDLYYDISGLLFVDGFEGEALSE